MGGQLPGRVADLFVLGPPPRPDEARQDGGDGDGGPELGEDPITAAVRLGAFVVGSGLAAGLALWATGRVVFDAARQLLR